MGVKEARGKLVAYVSHGEYDVERVMGRDQNFTDSRIHYGRIFCSVWWEHVFLLYDFTPAFTMILPRSLNRLANEILTSATRLSITNYLLSGRSK